ncbi:MAG: hypothetical protein J6B22_00715 [Clostridia bacterium]|nr:hypothetical protein [Clostridia bacterium]
MGIVKKTTCLLLVLALCVSMGGCKKKKKQIVIIKRPSSQVSDTTDNTDLDEVIDSDIVVDEESYESFRELAEKDDDTVTVREKEYSVKSVSFSLNNEYTVVYPNGDTQLKQAAQKLVDYFTENGVKLTIASDSSAAKEKEILVGNTNRLKSSLAENKYAVSVVDKKLFFESGNFNGVIKAVSWFISLKYEEGSVNTLTGEYEFSSTIKRDDGTYNFVWGDEFDGNALDMNKWSLTTSISAESSFKLSRDPAALNVSDGLLKLSALRWFDADNNQIQAIAPYTVEGKRYMNFQYGYLEMKARIPFGGGAWPSLWLSGACRQDSPVATLFERGDIIPSNFSAEIDIIEYTSLQPNLHKWFYDDAAGLENSSLIKDKHSSLGGVTKLTTSDLGIDPKESFVYQTIGFEWTPKDMTVYINGEKYFNYNWTESVQLDELNDMSDFMNPVFIRLNNHLIPKNIPSDFSSLPCEFFVEYVRLYQKPNTGGLWLAE